MPGKSTHKYVVTATGKLGTKSAFWIVGTFVDINQAKPWVALLNVARRANDEATVKAMDVHAPTGKDGESVTDVKYAGAKIQYAPEAPSLSDDAELS